MLRFFSLWPFISFLSTKNDQSPQNDCILWTVLISCFLYGLVSDAFTCFSLFADKISFKLSWNLLKFKVNRLIGNELCNFSPLLFIHFWMAKTIIFGDVISNAYCQTPFLRRDNQAPLIRWFFSQTFCATLFLQQFFTFKN